MNHPNKTVKFQDKNMVLGSKGSQKYQNKDKTKQRPKVRENDGVMRKDYPRISGVTP